MLILNMKWCRIESEMRCRQGMSLYDVERRACPVSFGFNPKLGLKKQTTEDYLHQILSKSHSEDRAGQSVISERD